MGLRKPDDGADTQARPNDVAMGFALRNYLVVTGGYWAFTLTDGGLGDHEVAGATIVTVGGPAFAAADVRGIPTVGRAGAAAFAVLLGLAAVLLLTRIRVSGP